jgi:hypothetical protein
MPIVLAPMCLTRARERSYVRSGRVALITLTVGSACWRSTTCMDGIILRGSLQAAELTSCLSRRNSSHSISKKAELDEWTSGLSFPSS